MTKTCETCIYLYDESSLTVCTKNKRWTTVDYFQECDIDSWEGGYTNGGPIPTHDANASPVVYLDGSYQVPEAVVIKYGDALLCKLNRSSLNCVATDQAQINFEEKK